MLLEKIENLTKEVEALQAANAEEIENLRLKYLSKKGAINALMQDFRTVAPEEKKEIGMKINALKQLAFDKINSLRDSLSSQESVDTDMDLKKGKEELYSLVIVDCFLSVFTFIKRYMYPYITF